jgi:hypothetical protein
MPRCPWAAAEPNTAYHDDGSQTEGNTYLYFAASPFPLQGKNQRKLKK